MNLKVIFLCQMNLRFLQDCQSKIFFHHTFLKNLELNKVHQLLYTNFLLIAL